MQSRFNNRVLKLSMSTLLMTVLLVAFITVTPFSAYAREQSKDNAMSAVSTDQEDLLVVNISSDAISFSSDKDVILHVVIANPNKYPVGVLKWLTPLDGIEESIFKVTRDGHPVDYLGFLAKRSAPTEEDYIYLQPGESAVSEVTLSSFYDFSVSGDYQVAYYVASEDLFSGIESSTGSLTSNSLNLFIEGRTTPGFDEAGIAAVTGTTGFTASCNSSMQASLINARTAASTYANDAYTVFSNGWYGTRYTTWFGMYDSSRYNTVSNHFTAIRNAVDTANPMTFDCSCSDPDYYAYVYPSQPYKIYLCGAFWLAPLTGTDSQAGALIHEVSHFYVVASTDDYVYGQVGSKNLAITNPSLAILNADNHEYFAENTPPLDNGAPTTLNISGSTSLGGVTLSYMDGSPMTATSASDGSYSFGIPFGWSGTVTPSLAGYNFSPDHRDYTSVSAHQLNQNYTAYKSFVDVPVFYWAFDNIERLYTSGITGGCGSSPLIYCPEATVTRGQMAVFLERGMNGSGFSPPTATGMVFRDIPVSYWSASWVEKLYADGVTGGCGDGNYCPEASVTRAQMAVFLLRAKHGAIYSPPAATGEFGDVPTSYWAASWIEQLTAEGITSGCGGGNYCPEQPVSRAQMAVFLVRTFNLP